MREILRRAILDNAALKLVSFILAVTLFILVRGEKDTVKLAHMRVVYTFPEDRVLMSEPLSEIRVMVKGPWTRVKRFDEKEMDPVHVDLTKVTDGELSFQEDMLRLPPGLQVISINPSSIRLEFQKTTTKSVPVEVTLDGVPLHGYKVERTVARPEKVTIRGAKSVVDATTSVLTRRIPVEGRSSSLVERTHLAPTEEHVQVVGGGPIEVELTIVEEPAQLTLADIPIEVSALSLQPSLAGRAEVTPTNATVVLRGGLNAIEAVSRHRVTAVVEAHADDAARGRGRKAPVLVQGVPMGVAVEVHPREVTLSFR
ncbi:MAG: hypothetical protein HY698_03745 [Deltaproteobacteria bacterium]|nr:hypothetical protein [Deltaproteobacteria bacterium]